MSRYMISVISKHIPLNEINHIGIKNNLKFTIINNQFVEKQIHKNNVQCYLVEWIENKFNSALPVKGEILTPPIEEVLSGINSYMGRLGNDYIIKLKEQMKKIYIEKSNAYKRDINSWISFLNEYFSKNPNDEFWLLLHWYSGSVDKEEFVIKNELNIIKGNLKQCIFENLEEDILYKFN